MDTLKDVLNDIADLNPQMVQNGRFSAPRILFYFDQCPNDLEKSSETPEDNIQTVEFNIEDRIFRILRTLRIITNNSENSLFAIPSNTPFVYVNDSVSNDVFDSDLNDFFMNIQTKSPIKAPEFPFSVTTNYAKKDRCFYNFLQKHIDLAFSEGFNDNISNAKNLPRTYFELPSLKMWIEVYKKLYDIFIVEEEYSELFLSEDNIPRDNILNVFDAETRFSNQRCLKIYPNAISNYYENLLDRYTTEVHESRVSRSLTTLEAYARGPWLEKFKQMAIEELNSSYDNSKRVCEKLSLFGNHCLLPIHDNSLKHNSQLQLLSFCNCGKTYQVREDPFELLDSNYLFYKEIVEKCGCHSIDFLESNHNIEFKDSEFSSKKVNLSQLIPDPEKAKATVHTQVVSNIDAINSKIPNGEIKEESNQLSILNKNADLMLTTTSPLSFIPPFPSWALVYVGVSSLYTHLVGISDNTFPGFISGSNFLLPIDLCFKLNKKNINKFKNYIKNRKATSAALTKFTVKLFIGLEYECPIGHRFMLSSPNKVLQQNDSIEKNSGLRVLRKDMPLFFKCCNHQSNKHQNLGIAQLMRIHVVTPKAPIQISLIPQVQVTANSPIFLPSKIKNLTLSQSAYWILKFPYCYATSKEKYLPIDCVNSSGKLSKGFIKIVHLFDQ